MEQYGKVISIRNKKTEYEKTQKENMVYFAKKAEAKRAMAGIKHNYLQEEWNAEIYQKKNKHMQNQIQLGRELTITLQKILQE